eukprot:gene9876-biopygen3750
MSHIAYVGSNGGIMWSRVVAIVRLWRPLCVLREVIPCGVWCRPIMRPMGDHVDNFWRQWEPQCGPQELMWIHVEPGGGSWCGLQGIMQIQMEPSGGSLGATVRPMEDIKSPVGVTVRLRVPSCAS